MATKTSSWALARARAVCIWAVRSMASTESPAEARASSNSSARSTPTASQAMAPAAISSAVAQRAAGCAET